MRDFEEELIALCEFDLNFSKKKLDEIKSNCKRRIGEFQSQEDYFEFFREFPLVQSVVRILFNYQMMLDEFKNGSNPFYGTTTELKKHPKNLETTLKQFRGALEISKKLSDTETVYRLERTINLFKAFLDNPSDLLSKLHFFKIIDGGMNEKQNHLMPFILHYNPFNDPLLTNWDDCVYYLEMLEFFDGFDIALEALAKSTFIKLHKIFELDNPDIYSQVNTPSEPIKSIFEKMGRSEQTIDFKRLKNVKPKTFYKGIAVFDYSKETDFLFNRYVEHAFQNSIKNAVIQDNLHKIDVKFHIKTGIDQVLKSSMQKMYRDLLSF